MSGEFLSPELQPDRRHVAVIDLGSNSWRVVVFGYVPGRWWKRVDELYETVRIGAGIGAAGELSQQAIERGLETLEVFERFCRAHALGADEIHPIATSAIREAPNRSDFLARAQQRTGLDIEVISAEEEARYGYVAAVNTTTLRDGAIVEIGGGSLQFVNVADRRATALQSFPLGAVRLTERFLHDGTRAKKKDLERVRAYVREVLARVDRPQRPVAVGMGGTIRNLAAAAQRAETGIDIGVQGYMIGAEMLDELVRRLAARPASERDSLPGIKPGRGDIILAGALTLQTILELGGFDGVEVTEAGLREGFFIARRLNEGQEPLLADVREAAVRNLAAQYGGDPSHTEHVAQLALQMHGSLADCGLFEPEAEERLLLWAAGMLHDVGMAISYDDHHKHSHYVIVSGELPGFDPRQRALIAQIARYHRKGEPKLGEIAGLARASDADLLARCAVILRLAEHLERGRDRAVSSVRFDADGEGDVRLQAAGDLALPRWTIDRYGDGELFRRVFGRRLVVG